MAAKEEEDLDLDVDQSAKSKKKLLIIILSIVILMVGGSVAAYFLLSEGDKASDEGKTGAEDKVKEHIPVIYSPMHKPFIINFEDTRKARYVQIEITAMSHVQDSLDLFTEHSPVIRNNFITILSSQNYTELSTREGKEKLNAELLKSVNATIAAEVENSPPPAKEGDDDGEKKEKNTTPPKDKEHVYIDALYFTSFVMQ